jgi:hypothetical protein
MGDAKRAKKLRERERRFAQLQARHTPKPALPPGRLRAIVAEAVHRAVTEHTGTDGLGCCMLYALVGMMTASRVLKAHYVPAAGSLYLIPDPADPTFAVAFEGHRRGFESPEFHCWFVRIDGQYRALEAVDLSARHYRRMVTDFITVTGDGVVRDGVLLYDVDRQRPTWRREDPPPFLWVDRPADNWPLDLCSLNADRDASVALAELFLEHKAFYKPLWLRAVALAEAAIRRAQGPDGGDASADGNENGPGQP